MKIRGKSGREEEPNRQGQNKGFSRESWEPGTRKTKRELTVKEIDGS